MLRTVCVLQVFMSKPHFLHGDPSLVTAVEGLTPPNPAQHDAYLDVEPVGAPQSQSRVPSFPVTPGHSQLSSQHTRTMCLLLWGMAVPLFSVLGLIDGFPVPSRNVDHASPHTLTPCLPRTFPVSSCGMHVSS